MGRMEKLFEEASGHFEPAEALILGSYEGTILGADTARQGIMLATNHRIVFYAKKFGGYDLQALPYSSISLLEQSKGLMGHTLTFHASGARMTVKQAQTDNLVNTFVALVRPRIGRGRS